MGCCMGETGHPGGGGPGWQQRHLGDRVPLGSVCPVARWGVPVQGRLITQVPGEGEGARGDSLHSLSQVAAAASMHITQFKVPKTLWDSKTGQLGVRKQCRRGPDTSQGRLLGEEERKPPQDI